MHQINFNTSCSTGSTGSLSQVPVCLKGGHIYKLASIINHLQVTHLIPLHLNLEQSEFPLQSCKTSEEVPMFLEEGCNINSISRLQIFLKSLQIRLYKVASLQPRYCMYTLIKQVEKLRVRKTFFKINAGFI